MFGLSGTENTESLRRDNPEGLAGKQFGDRRHDALDFFLIRLALPRGQLREPVHALEDRAVGPAAHVTHQVDGNCLEESFFRSVISLACSFVKRKINKKPTGVRSHQAGSKAGCSNYPRRGEWICRERPCRSSGSGGTLRRE